MAEVYKGAGTRVARMTGNHSVMDAAAGAILARAKAGAAATADTGAYGGSMSVMRTPGQGGVTDRLVVAADKGAIHIEYGHLETGKTGKMTWVPGKYILSRAIKG